MPATATMDPKNTLKLAVAQLTIFFGYISPAATLLDSKATKSPSNPSI